MAADRRYDQIPIQAGGKNPKERKKNGFLRRILWVTGGLTTVAAVVVVAVVLVAYSGRWNVVSRRMAQVCSDGYNRVYGAGYVVQPGDHLGDIEFFKRLRLLGYRMVDSKKSVAGSYWLSADTIYLQLVPSGDAGGDGGGVAIRLKDSVVEQIIPTTNPHHLLDSLDLGRPLVTRYLDSIWELREARTYSSLPKPLIAAVLAAEDRRFFSHHGIDYKGIGRAAIINAGSGAIRQGGSTITQQLIKTFTKRTQRTYQEKFYEVLLALHLELVYEKEEILAAYLNNVYMGHVGPFGLHGVAAAATYLFGKDASALSPGECATLAVMIRSPNRLSPLRNSSRNLSRAIIILQILKQQGQLDGAYLYDPLQWDKSAGQAARSSLLALAWAWQELEAELGRQEGDVLQGPGRVVLEISIDPLMQHKAGDLVASQLEKMEQQQKIPVSLQSAVVMIEQKSGEVRALIGGRDYLISQFNRASQAERPVGSLIKPFVYLAAMSVDRHLTPATSVLDSPLVLKTTSGSWQPRNFDHRYKGTITLEDALISSRNIPAVRIGLKASLSRVAGMIQSVGINDVVRPYPSLFLGACLSSPLRMAAAYAALAKNGMYVAPQLIDRVIVGDTVVLLRRPKQVQVLDSDECRVMTEMLKKVLVSGTGRSAKKYGLRPGPAGKTGTSNKMRDAWFAGYSDTLTTVVWVGNDQNKPIRMTGAGAALPIWALAMKKTGRGVTPSKKQVLSTAIAKREIAVEPVLEQSQGILVSPGPKRHRMNMKPSGHDSMRSKSTLQVLRTRTSGDQPLAGQQYKFFK